jgi:integrase/recombinase XerC
MPDRLPELIEQYTASLRRENASAHTVRNYEADLRGWLDYMTPPNGEPPAVEAIDVLSVREWLAHLHEKEHQTASVRRRLAALRSFFRYLERRGIVERNPARLVRTPKLAQTLPSTPTAEVTNNLIDSVALKGEKDNLPHVARDIAIFELLYGCGIRVSELSGLNLHDVEFDGRWLRVRGKGKKEREAPFSARVAAALERYLPERKSAPRETALFTNHQGRRLSDRGIRAIVHRYADAFMDNDSVHPHTFRHAYATHMLAEGADLRTIQELLGHARLSTTQKYTQVALSDLMRVYDKCHPKA